ncbi:hypothetical protein BLNAU_8855 [Blattamonas nauphoetae]|uniref:Uncharacterized protein n=1 Tax=Blattamonas nauphoetae TaxID=2049346 RepID=A0ABQ9XXS8_9EUKA|nr:hypothetical protein BLNAU_8855 [Blattamonas nauphoetae]
MKSLASERMLKEHVDGLEVNESWDEIAQRIKNLGGNRTAENCAMLMHATKRDLKKLLQENERSRKDGEEVQDETQERLERE